MKILRILSCLLVSSLMQFSCQSSKTTPYQLSDDIDMLLAKQWKPDQPGMAVLVWENGKVLSENYMGKTGQADGSSLTSNTTFRMASVSKQFTATAILLLEKQGKLQLTQSVKEFFPELPEWSSSITLQHLLTHTSGIIDYESLMPANWTHQIQDRDVLALLKESDTTYFSAGSQFRYSNTGFCLLSLVVEEVAKQPYATFMQEQIFGPLEMTNTFLYEIEKPVMTRAIGFRKNADGSVTLADQSTTSATKGDGCVYTSVRDYQKWFKAIQEKTLIDIESYIRKYGYLFDEDQATGYGFGWFYRLPENEKDGIELTHTGSTSGFSNVVVMIPEKDLLVLYFSNIANQHSLFNIIQQHVKKSITWNIDWEKMHLQTN